MILKRILLILVGIGLCFCLELIARLVLPENKLNLMESIHTVCREDNELLWRQKSNLNTMFQGKHVITNSLGLRNDEIMQHEKENMYRLICLGGSSTFGWGVDREKTYPLHLENLINKCFDQKIAEVINAGQIGYTSYQGKKFFKKYLLEYSPDIITVSYVLNDIDKVRFFKNEKLSDSQISFSGSEIVEWKSRIIDKRIYFLAKRFTLWLMRKNSKLTAAVYKNQYENSKIRVSAGEYRENLQDIIATCKSRNIKLIFIIMPINLALPEISGKTNGSQLSNYYYQKAVKCEKIKDYKNAELFFKKALEHQVFICKKNGVLYQNIMMQVAQENKIPFVNAEELFSSGLYGQMVDLFNGSDDRIHPNDAGHRLIANALYECIINNAMLVPNKEMKRK
ncbi:MAG: SGNH/GDSL hydrolase family protein [Candidatus Omnitrophota bacterium]